MRNVKPASKRQMTFDNNKTITVPDIGFKAEWGSGLKTTIAIKTSLQ